MACHGQDAVYFEGKCYEVSDTKLNGSMAEEFCRSTAMGGAGSDMMERPTLEDTFFLRGTHRHEHNAQIFLTNYF